MNEPDAHTSPSFSLGNRLARVAWNTVYLLLVRYSPTPFHGWRVLLLRLFGAKVGRGVHIYPRVKIWAPWNVRLSDECGIANGVILYSQGKISIGKRAVVSQGSHLCAGTHDYSRPHFPLITKPIHVGDFAWIAAEAFIHPGVSIGEGAVIGARSVVTKNMPAWQVCSGFPCVHIRPRVRPENIDTFRNTFIKNA